MKKCKRGWNNGECCCNCIHQLKLYKHPSNKKYKGNISEETDLYVCAVEHHLENNNKVIVMENKHGMCELHVFKN